MTPGLFAAVALTTALAQGRVDTASNDLTTVRDLYASASYEEALTELVKKQDSLDTEQIEQYRALCLLGLGRSSEAQRSLERLVVGKPLFVLSEADVPPRLLTMFHDVRRRLLPSVTRNLYVRAKTNFDAKNYVAASAQLREMLAILGDDDMADEAGGFADLKMLGEGFLRLTDTELVASAKAAAAAAAATAAATPTPAASVLPRIYSVSDTDVTAPVELERKMPIWSPANAVTRSTEYRGVLEVVITEQGTVESATLRESVTPIYDKPLLAAAGNWRYQPATRNGAAVKYRKTINIVLSAK